ncbi:MAG TPA: preprotein translocase subunit YajC [Gaiellaceae bacterium]|jgi:preprotein translocase subunit YajC|nr:preprotein translocase subunit YajC [Gaiellaceae bacterium]
MLGASGGSSFFFIIIIAFVFLWFVIIRPQKKRQMDAARMLNTLNVGDEVVTAGGIYGEITGLEEDSVRVRIAPELEVRVARKAIGAVVPREAAEEPEEAEPDSTEPQAPETDG